MAQQRAEVLDEACEGLSRSHPAHYERSGEEVTRERLADLIDVIVTALRDRQLEPVARYVEAVAEHRFETGFGMAEVQTAFNVMEETIWRHVVATMRVDELAEALGLRLAARLDRPAA